MLTETHEHDRCRVPDFEGYKKISLWNENIDNGKGHGGITVLIKETWSRFINLEKEDVNKQYIWIKITENQISTRVVVCYFAPKGSKMYKKYRLDREDPFAAFKKDIASFSSLGEIMITGYFNARTANNQTLNLKESYNESRDPQRRRDTKMGKIFTG